MKNKEPNILDKGWFIIIEGIVISAVITLFAVGITLQKKKDKLFYSVLFTLLVYIFFCIKRIILHFINI